MNKLFTPIQVGAWALANRIVMAPLTRNRATGGLPNALMAEYYRQRANPATGAALIVSEGTPVGPMAHGYLDTPGLHSDAQASAWRQVTDTVHAQGGKIVSQLWHVGRVSHTSLLPGGAAPVSSSARVAAQVRTFTREGFVPTSVPRALLLEEIAAVVDDFRQAARRALLAGFDGVEIHGANGYLIDQFLRDSCNDRTDAYGGSIANRCRFAVDVARAVADEIGANRTGIRLSPVSAVNGIGQDSAPQALFNHLAEQLAPLQLAYCHVVEGQTGGERDSTGQGAAPFDYAQLRARFGAATAWMVNNGYTREMALQAVEHDGADLVAFGRGFIANPDLGRRLRAAAALNALDAKTLYGGGAAGYTDYPGLGA